MFGHPQLNVLTFLSIAFLPALTALVLACVAWIAGRHTQISPWRLVTFKWGLIAAFVDTLLFLPAAIRFLAMGSPATGIWFAANCLSFGLLILVFAAVFTGKGWSRALLILWSVLLVLGVFMVYARVP
jgi:hypothetical protein